METFEIAYYLSGQQLLLLLSLIDQRPVAGLPPIAEPEDWRETSLSLLRDRRLRYEDGRLVMDGDLGGLLLDLKNAERIYALYGGSPAVRVAYAGEGSVLLELLPEGNCRLRRLEAAELRQLVGELAPVRPMPEALEDSLPDDAALRERLSRWEEDAVPPEASPALWQRLEEVRGILEYQLSGERIRWIWVEDGMAGLLLRQDRRGTRAELDTASRRQSLLRELGLEA